MRTFWINTTNDCNLNCIYCYQKEKKREYLELNQIDSVIKDTKKYNEDIHINFFGGEPLLNFPIIKKIVLEISKRRNYKTTFSMTTNLTVLNKEIFNFLTEHDVGISVSFDGDEKSYNSGRFKKDSEINYHSIVTENLNKFIEIDYPYITLLKVISYNNYLNLFHDCLFFSNFKYPIYFNFDQDIANWNNPKINLEKFKIELSNSFQFYLKNNLKQFMYFNDIIHNVISMFDSNEVFQKRKTCTNYENISYSFDVNAKVFPCHFISELYSQKQNNLCSSTIEELNKKIRNTSYFEKLTDEEKHTYARKNSYKEDCNNCGYSYICSIEKMDLFKDICIFNIYQLKNNLISKTNKGREFFCKKKFLYDIVFNFINNKGVGILDNFS